MNLIDENTTRKIDSLGRISVPKGIRNRMHLDNNQEMSFYTFKYEGREYVAFAPVAISDMEEEEKCLTAFDLLVELGIDVPDELSARLSSFDGQ